MPSVYGKIPGNVKRLRIYPYHIAKNPVCLSKFSFFHKKYYGIRWKNIATHATQRKKPEILRTQAGRTPKRTRFTYALPFGGRAERGNIHYIIYKRRTAPLPPLTGVFSSPYPGTKPPLRRHIAGRQGRKQGGGAEQAERFPLRPDGKRGDKSPPEKIFTDLLKIMLYKSTKTEYSKCCRETFNLFFAPCTRFVLYQQILCCIKK